MTRPASALRSQGMLKAALIPAIALSALMAGPGAQAEGAKSGGREWLAANRKSPEFGQRLLEAAGAEPSVEASLQLIAEHYPWIEAGEARKRAAALAAECRELSGAQDASSWYEKAALAVPGETDPGYMLRAAYCRIARGEYEEAAKDLEAAGGRAVRPPGSLSAQALSLIQAKASLAGLWLSLARGQAGGLEEKAVSLMGQAANAPLRASFLFFLCALEARTVSGGPNLSRSIYENSLVSEFPGSPEAALVGSLSDGTAPGSAPVALSPEPFWLFSGFLIERSRAPEANAAKQAPTPVPESPASTATAAAATATPGPAAAAGSIRSFQIGSFSQKANADSLKASLSAKGFSAAMSEKTNAGGKRFYVVSVSAGSDPQLTDLRLKEAGYEALPVF
jgi:hypothetical protein